MKEDWYEEEEEIMEVQDFRNEDDLWDDEITAEEAAFLAGCKKADHGEYGK